MRAGDGPLLRLVMLQAAAVPGCEIERRVFQGRRPEDWEALAAALSDARRQRIVLLETAGEQAPAGVLWLTLDRSTEAVDLGWWWVDPALEGTEEEQALMSWAEAWAIEQGAHLLRSTAIDQRELGYCRRTGFRRAGTTSDGRPVFVSSCEAVGGTHEPGGGT